MVEGGEGGGYLGCWEVYLGREWEVGLGSLWKSSERYKVGRRARGRDVSSGR